MAATTSIGFDAVATLNDAGLAKFAAEGGKYIMLYEKTSTPAYVQMIFKHGLSIGLIWETTAERALGGYVAGMQDAQAFIDRAPHAFGVMPPASVAPALTVDFDCTEAELPAVISYIDGWDAGLGHAFRTMVYANGLVCQAARTKHLVDFTWEAGTSGWTGTKFYRASDDADLVQDVGDKQHLTLAIDIDSDLAKDPGLPWAWHPPQAGQVSVPPTLPPPVVPAPSPLPALKVAQAALGVTADGIWGPHTAAAFAAYYTKAAA